MILHIVPGLGRSQGGPSYSVPRLCAALTEAGAATRLCSVADPHDPPFADVNADLFDHDLAGVPVLRNLRASKSLHASLKTVAPQATHVHVHGMWLLPNVQAGKVAQQHRRPLIVSPRGMLAADALRISRRRKMVFWNMLQKSAYAGAAAWHATCEEEAEEIRRFGVRAPIAVIPNGIDVPPVARSVHRAAQSKTVLFVGRVHPKKGLPSLVEAWSALPIEFSQWRLRIVGPDENGHAIELRRLAGRLGARGLSIEPALYGSAKSEAFQDASLFVLPTLNENFGVAVAEALGAGVPAIVTRGAPWSGLETEKCGWWVDHGVQSLTAALTAALRTPPDELHAMGARGRNWMIRDFGWDRIARDTLAVYDWLKYGGARPQTVRLL